MSFLFLFAGMSIGVLTGVLFCRLKIEKKFAGWTNPQDLEEKYVLKAIFLSEQAHLLEKCDELRKENEENFARQNIYFENIATKVLSEQNSAIINQSAKSMDAILSPLKEKLNSFERKVEETYNNETREKATLRQELLHIIETSKKMSEDATNLTKALKGDSKVQGDWGELQLEVLLEKSGLTEGINFKKQANFKTDSGENLRPDFTIFLPDEKHYIIDSKVSLTAYEQYFNSDNEDIKARALKEHLASIKKHIDELSQKKYEQISAITSPDFVFMFVPIEPALTLALNENPGLVEYALNKNVMLVVPTTLMFAMRTVAFIWKVERQNRNVQDIAKVGGELYDKFVLFTENMIKVGTSMDNSKKIYAEAMGQLTKDTASGTIHGGTIVGKVEALKKLGANTTKSINPNLLERIA